MLTNAVFIDDDDDKRPPQLPLDGNLVRVFTPFARASHLFECITVVDKVLSIAETGGCLTALRLDVLQFCHWIFHRSVRKR